MEKVLSASNLKVHFPVYKGVLFQKQIAAVKAVDGITLDIAKGETLGLVGESGCGKSTLGRCAIRLYKPTSGTIEIAGQDITHAAGADLRAKRKEFQMIFQDPHASLNPRMTVYDILAEPLVTHGFAKSKSETEKQVKTLMDQVGLSPRFVKKYPHEFSGGQKQRIAIARALAVKPKLIVCDEPVSALDISIQAQILNLLTDLQKEFQLTYLFISHDLSVVRHIADRVAVMYLGKIVEIARKNDLFTNPLHPYTKALLNAIPTPDPKAEHSRPHQLLEGEIPSPLNPPSGCSFHPRCPIATNICKSNYPSSNSVSNEHEVFCHHADIE